MKPMRELFTNANFVLKLIEFVLCLGGIIYYQHTLSPGKLLILHGWFFVSLCYIIAYMWERPNPWVQLFALGIYIVLMAITAFMGLTVQAALPGTLAVLLMIDLVFVIIYHRPSDE